MTDLRRYFLLVFAAAWFAFPASLFGDPWPQFRGPNGSGVSAEKDPLPAEVAPERNVVWQVEMPAGVSSPVIHGDRLYLTAVKDENELVTMAIDPTDGRVIWEMAAPINKFETTDKRPQGRLATPTPVTDGKHVVVFFGSSGLLCYNRDGELLWHRAMGPFQNQRGATSSPVIADDRILLIEDHEVGSFIAAFDLSTGKTVWRTERMLFNRSYGTPVLWQHKDRTYVVAVGSGLVTAYDLVTGTPTFFMQGTSCVANPTPVVGDDGVLYVASANPGPKREFQPTFAELLKQRDGNQDERLTEDDLPAGLFRTLVLLYDADRSGDLSPTEYASIQRLMGTCNNGMIALSAGGVGLDRTEANFLWHSKKSVPRTASPLYHQGHLYMINDGGVFASVDATTGQIVKSGRTPAKGKFFGSPVLGDGKIFFASDRGELVVVSADPEWKVLSSANFDEPIYPTPAVSGGRLYLRTESKLYCFGNPKGT